MQRAAVLIGVSRTGGLTALQAVASGVGAMAAWAEGQGIAPDRIIRISDADGGQVTAADVKAAIKGLCQQGSVEQLLLYFAGHGVNLRYGEYWLLSGAPDDTQEAVNVAGSVELARHCGIGHVVIVSDACRTAASGIKAQNVTGSEVFPNVGAAGPERPVDLFFAATLGHESLEVQDPAAAVATYRGVFTESLVSALSGEQPDVVERLDGDGVALVRPRPLKRFLMRDVDRRLRAAQVAMTVFQEPDARITSDDDAWLSRLPLPAAPPAPPTAPPGMPGAGEPDGGRGGEVGAHEGWAGAEPEEERPAARTRRLLRGSLAPTAAMPGAGEVGEVDGEVSGTSGVVAAQDVTGIVVRGARVASAESWQADVRVVGDDRVVADGLTGAAADVLLTLDDGTAVVLPVFADHAYELGVRDGELRDVTLSPTASADRPEEHRSRDAALRALRAAVVEGSRLGVLRLEDDEADLLLDRMRTADGVDPVLALLAGYAFDDERRLDLVAWLDQAVADVLGARLFDLAMLVGDLDGRAPRPGDDVFPSTPLLARGWATLRARGIRLDPAYDGIEGHLRPSLWTVLDAEGAAMARTALSRTPPTHQEEDDDA